MKETTNRSALRNTRQKQQRQAAAIVVGTLAVALCCGVLCFTTNVYQGHKSESWTMNGNAAQCQMIAAVHSAYPEKECGTWIWPVKSAVDHTITRKADIPAENWQKGHRGVDLPAQDGAVLLAPEEGTIVFSGKVGGKDVVSFRTRDGALVSFEPATSSLKTGERVGRGEEMAHRQGGSDHCGRSCVHLGVRFGNAYCDPLVFLFGESIRLKPLQNESSNSGVGSTNVAAIDEEKL